MRPKKLLSIERWKIELISPTRPISTKLMNLFWRVSRFNKKQLSRNKDNIFIWDSRYNSITFDFVFALFQASQIFKHVNNKKFDVIIYVPKPPESTDYMGYNQTVSNSELYSRIEKIIKPLAEMWSDIGSTIYTNKPSEVQTIVNSGKYNIYPILYSSRYRPRALDYLKVFKYLKQYNNLKLFNLCFLPPNNLELINCITKSYEEECTNSIELPGKYITLTLRDYGYNAERDTSQYDVDAANTLAAQLRATLVIIPDSTEGLKKYIFPKNCLFSLKARSSLYHRTLVYKNSDLNIFRPSGPAGVSLFLNGPKTIYVGIGAGGFDGDYAYYKKHHGWNFGDQPYLQLDGYLLWTRSSKNDYSSLDMLHAYDLLDKN